MRISSTSTDDEPDWLAEWLTALGEALRAEREQHADEQEQRP